MEMFSEVEWKKSSDTTQELVCNCRSESVFAPQVVKTFVTTRCIKGFFHRELLEKFLKEFVQKLV